MLYALTFTFLSQLIEGDEFYTKVEKNKPIEECEGWTVILMKRATRFIWALQCGKKDRLFLPVIHILKRIIKKTDDISLITDGERRYGLILFEICNEILKSGKRGLPLKVLRTCKSC